MLVAATPYHLPQPPQAGTFTLTNIPQNQVPIPIAIHQSEYANQKKRNTLETDALVQKALRDAWEQYGPKTQQRVAESNLPPGAWRIPEGQYPSPANPANFQPVTSEWDPRITTIPVRNRPVLQPGIFSRVLARYVELEVNHHEIADFIRRVVVGFFVVIIAIGWIFLGLAIGFIPLHIFGWTLGKRNLEGKGYEDSAGKSKAESSTAFNVRNDIMREITERVFLALDGDWLQKLEQKVKKGTNGRWLKTHVHCCIMPDAKAKGMAECQLIRRARKVSSPFKCLSDLIYDIQFGPADTVSSSSNSTLTPSSPVSSKADKHFF